MSKRKPSPPNAVAARALSARRQAAAVTAIASSVEITKGAENLSLYAWGTGTAKHYFCKTCGIYTHHQRRSNPEECGINLGCIEGQNEEDWTRAGREYPGT